MVNIPVSAYGSVLVITPTGPLYEGRTAEALFTLVREIVSDGDPKLVIDLTSVPWVRSLGIGTLMGCRTDCLAAGGSFALTGVNERITELMNSLHLDKVFDCFDTLEEAVIANGGTVE